MQQSICRLPDIIMSKNTNPDYPHPLSRMERFEKIRKDDQQYSSFAKNDQSHRSIQDDMDAVDTAILTLEVSPSNFWLGSDKF